MKGNNTKCQQIKNIAINIASPKKGKKNNTNKRKKIRNKTNIFQQHLRKNDIFQ